MLNTEIREIRNIFFGMIWYTVYDEVSVNTRNELYLNLWGITDTKIGTTTYINVNNQLLEEFR
jgi:hypothetical protein